MKITNLLSLFRFVCAFIIASLFIWLIKSNKPEIWQWIFWVFIVGCITDFLDGYIARKKNMVTTFGEIIDPIADKALINVSLLIILPIFILKMPVIFILVILMFIRDFTVNTVRIYMASNNLKVAASIWGKVKTILQMIAIILTFAMFAFPNSWINFKWVVWTFIFATMSSIMSGYDYVIKVWKKAKEN